MSAIEPLVLESRSPAATEAIGEGLAALLSPGTTLALYGDLAAGKTCLVRGLARHFGARDAVHSPTFTLVNEYGEDVRLHHLDLYRLGGAEELADLGLEEMVDTGICAIEWAERAEGMLPKRRVELHLEHAGGDLRRIRISDHGVLPLGWQRQFDGPG